MPRTITIDRLFIDDRAHPKGYRGPFLFSDFNPKNTSEAYIEKFPYLVTEDVVLKNVRIASGKPINLSPNRHMFRNVRLSRTIRRQVAEPSSRTRESGSRNR
jgi:hypothetical protein